MSNTVQRAAPFPFLLVLVFFLLPFAELSCKEQKVARVSGYNAAFGGRMEGMINAQKQAPTKTMEASPILIGVLILAGLGAVCAWTSRNLLASLGGILAVVLLVMWRQDVDDHITRETIGTLILSTREGYLGSMVSFALGALLCGWAGLSGKPSSSSTKL